MHFTVLKFIIVYKPKHYKKTSVYIYMSRFLLFGFVMVIFFSQLICSEIKILGRVQA